MDAVAINQIDNIATFQLKGNYQFKDQEPVEINSTESSFLEELRGLFWELIHWTVTAGKIWELPADDVMWFKPGEKPRLQEAKLYTLLRFRVGFTKTDYDKDGLPQVQAKSTANGSIKEQEFSDIYSQIYQYLANYIDMTDFNIQHQQAREKLGKFY